jgi:GH15 family glucan-1,4-alpha-glucosidase
VLGTIDAIQREICSGPFVWRYSTGEEIDGLAGSEGSFVHSEYDSVGRRLLGNFPQAFSHIGLLHSIFTISEVNALVEAK